MQDASPGGSRSPLSYILPSAERASDLRGAMSRALLDSTRALLEKRNNRSIEHPSLMSGPITASDFASYFDLALADCHGLLDRDFLNEPAEYLSNRIRAIENEALSSTPKAVAIRISTLSDQFYTREVQQRLCRWWDSDAENHLDLIAVTRVELDQAKRHVREAFDFLSWCDPELFFELTTYIPEIVIAKTGPHGRGFDGASSFALWGAAVINAEKSGGWPAYFQTLVHEASHTMLFAISRDQPLILNDLNERAFSPLRNQDRPLDGVYHAAFVSARECLAFDRLLSWHDRTHGLSDDEAALINQLMSASVVAFYDCAEAVKGSATLSGLASAILADCEEFMSATFRVEV